MVAVIMSTGQAGDLRSRVPLTQKHGTQRLTEEPLTFFPDAQCCPPSPAMPGVQINRRAADGARTATICDVAVATKTAIAVTLSRRLGSQRELVGRR